MYKLNVFSYNFCREAFLAMNNVHAYQSVTDNLHFGLPPLSDAWESCITCISMHLPQPLDPGSKEAKKLYPWLRCGLLGGLSSFMMKQK